MTLHKTRYNDKLVVARAIERERRYQDQKWGTLEEHPHTIQRWVEIMQAQLEKAESGLHSKESALAEIIQAVAVGHACLEQYGIVNFREVSNHAC